MYHHRYEHGVCPCLTGVNWAKTVQNRHAWAPKSIRNEGGSIFLQAPVSITYDLGATSALTLPNETPNLGSLSLLLQFHPNGGTQSNNLYWGEVWWVDSTKRLFPQGFFLFDLFQQDVRQRINHENMQDTQHVVQLAWDRPTIKHCQCLSNSTMKKWRNQLLLVCYKSKLKANRLIPQVWVFLFLKMK